MKKLLIILYLLCSITMQAKEINEHKTHKKGAKTDGNRKEKHLNKQQLQWGVWDAIVDFADWLTIQYRNNRKTRYQ